MEGRRTTTSSASQGAASTTSSSAWIDSAAARDEASPMPIDSTSRNWFDRGGLAYARYRPAYPPYLARSLAASSPSRDRAVDVGCGNGQLTAQLADHFDEVIGLDPSPDQIANARPRPGLRYLCAPAEAIPLADHCASL